MPSYVHRESTPKVKTPLPFSDLSTPLRIYSARSNRTIWQWLSTLPALPSYPEYKAQREATPEDIKWAVPIIKEIIAAYRIPIIEVAGYEADDVIGTLAVKGAEAGMEVEMITPDKDYAQLVRPGVTMCRPGNGAKGMERLGVEEVCTKYGLEHPEQVIDMLGLMGDAADNIPGCPGVGEKTAVKLLQEFSNIEQLLGPTERSHQKEGGGECRKNPLLKIPCHHQDGCATRCNRVHPCCRRKS